MMRRGQRLREVLMRLEAYKLIWLLFYVKLCMEMSLNTPDSFTRVTGAKRQISLGLAASG